MSTYVFLGPTLSHEAARSLLPAIYRPPASVGDVYRAACRGARRIVIVDGYFQRVPAIWHKEILFALANGVAVFGCASMGALRAAEMHPFGMVGVGEIFAAYATGTCEDDDEVAVAHEGAETGYRPTSEPMVNLRYGLSRAAREGVITPDDERELALTAKKMFYPERRWDTVIRSSRSVPERRRAALGEFVSRTDLDLKRRDAVTCLGALYKNSLRTPRTIPRTPFVSTESWRALTAIEGRLTGD
jgi:hypothetical protein